MFISFEIICWLLELMLLYFIYLELEQLLTLKGGEQMNTNEPTQYIKMKGEEYAFAAINLVIDDEAGWIEFDRINTKTNANVGHFQVTRDEVISIETRREQPPLM